MTMWQFVIGCLIVYAVIYLHRKHGFKWILGKSLLAAVLFVLFVVVIVFLRS